MAYHVFTLTDGLTGGPANSEPQLVQAFDHYRDARQAARRLREDLRQAAEGPLKTVKIVFAADAPQARRLLAQKREARPLGEDS